MFKQLQVIALVLVCRCGMWAGTPPDAINPPKGCPFTARCPYTMKVCGDEMPEVTRFSEEHWATCWLHHPMAPKVDPPTRVGGRR